METDYSAILTPIILAVMVAYNRPVTLEEIVEGVTEVLSYLRDQMDTGISNGTEANDSSNYGQMVRSKPKRRRH